MRNYVYENTLCRVATDFDARLCKTWRVVLPIDDDDVVNKRFMQQNMQILKDRQDTIEKNMQILKNGQDEIEKKITSLQTNRQFMLKYLQENIQTFENQSGDTVVSRVSSISSDIQVYREDIRHPRRYRVSLRKPARCEHMRFLYLKNDWTDQILNRLNRQLGYELHHKSVFIFYLHTLRAEVLRCKVKF